MPLNLSGKLKKNHCTYQGDGHIFSIAAASIIAKVTRDRIMIDLDKIYPVYGLAKHKVSTKLHQRVYLIWMLTITSEDP